MNKILSIVLFISLIAFSSCNETVSKVQDVLTFEKNKTIGIQAFENFDQALVDTVKQTIEDVYRFKVIILNRIDLPKEAYTNIKSSRYRADTLIRFLRKIKSDSIDHILGLTNKDISFTKKDKSGNIKKPEYKYEDWGIFGLAFVPGSTCVISTYRLKKNKTKFIERFKKVCIHELGHNLGLKHCKFSEKCVMCDAAETIKTVDRVDLKLCNKCKQKIGI